MANSSVRANAVALLIDVFPLQSNDNSPQAADELLQRQFDAFKVMSMLVHSFFSITVFARVHSGPLSGSQVSSRWWPGYKLNL